MMELKELHSVLVELEENQITSTPSIGLKVNQKYIEGIGKLNEKFIFNNWSTWKWKND